MRARCRWWWSSWCPGRDEPASTPGRCTKNTIWPSLRPYPYFRPSWWPSQISLKEVRWRYSNQGEILKVFLVVFPSYFGRSFYTKKIRNKRENKYWGTRLLLKQSVSSQQKQPLLTSETMNWIREPFHVWFRTLIWICLSDINTRAQIFSKGFSLRISFVFQAECFNTKKIRNKTENNDENTRKHSFRHSSYFFIKCNRLDVIAWSNSEVSGDAVTAFPFLLSLIYSLPSHSPSSLHSHPSFLDYFISHPSLNSPHSIHLTHPTHQLPLFPLELVEYTTFHNTDRFNL